MREDVLIQNLEKRGFEAVFFETSKEAVEFMVERISGKSVGIGGSLTVKEMGLDEALSKENAVFWHWDAKLVEELGGAKAVRDQAQDAQVYLSSVNAIARTGQIVNIDGTGNRIASLAYGHEEVYLLVGKNKITDTLEDAMDRAKNVAAPKNAMRLHRKTPCAIKGDKCYHCYSPDCICNGYLIHEHAMSGMKMVVVVIGEELGA